MNKYPEVKISRAMKYLLIPKALWLWARYNVMVWLLKRRNRPMPILVHPDPKLARIAEPVDFKKESYDELSTIVRKMGNALSSVSYGGKLGLAAPQIGINKRICIVQGAVMFNPHWQPSKAPLNMGFEGCYSVPNREFKVWRAPYGWATWQSIEGVQRSKKMHGQLAVVFQHELDHLDGKCCVDVGEEVPAKSG